MLGRINNAIVEEFNKTAILPKFIVMILDSEIIEMAEVYDCGMHKIMFDCLEWLRSSVIQNIMTRKDDLKSKRKGSIGSEDEPKLIWVEAVPRPKNSAKKEIYLLVGKFNEILQELINSAANELIFTLKTVNELNCFDACGRLMPIGKERFWKELDYQLCLLHNGDWESEKSKQATPNDNHTRGNNCVRYHRTHNCHMTDRLSSS